MAFMKRDVNIGLLILIIAAIILFSGFSVYYQTTFKGVSLEYKNKLEQLSKVTKDLAAQKQALNETYSLRVKAEQDKKTLDSRYNEVRDENEQFRTDNENLRTEISSTKSQLAEKTAELNLKNTLLAQTEAELSSAKAQRDTYKNRLDSVCNAYTTLNNGVEHDKC